MDQDPAFTERFNQFLYRRHLRKLGPGDIDLAREWCFTFIRREHPHWTQPEIDQFYENLVNVRLIAVDEWTRRMT